MSTVAELEQELEKVRGQLASAESAAARDRYGISGGLASNDIPTAVVIPTSAEGDGIEPDEAHMLKRLWSVWSDRRNSNWKRIMYRSGKNIATNLGLAFKNANDIANKIHPVCGWPAKAVEELADLSRLDYVTFPDDGADDDLLRAWEDNDIDTLYSMAADSQLTEGVVHWTVTAGDVDAGEPPVIVNAYSALSSASVWDRRHRCIAYGMVVNEIADDGAPSELTLHARDKTLVMTRKDGVWYSARTEHGMGRCLMEPMPYRPTLDRPLGKSRITGAVMSITDNAVREVMRSEVAAEVYTVPKRAILGLKASQLPKDPKTYWNAIDALPLTDAGTQPNYVQLQPPGMNDHITYMRQLAAQFSGETRLPLSSLGVVSDNPSSAEAIYAAKEGLIIEAENMNRNNSRAIKNVARMMMAVAKGVPFDELPDNLARVRPHWVRPDREAQPTRIDSVVKLASAIDGFGNTKEALRMSGFDEGEVERIMSEMGRDRGLSILDRLGEAPPVSFPYAVEQEDEAEVAVM